MKNLEFKFRFNPVWSYSASLPRTKDQDYTITEVNQICPLFKNDENKTIGHVIISGILYESIDKKKNYLYKSNHTYVLQNGVLNATYNFKKTTGINGDNTVFPSNTVFRTPIAPGGSGIYAFSSGKIILRTDTSFVRKVVVKFTE